MPNMWGVAFVAVYLAAQGFEIARVLSYVICFAVGYLLGAWSRGK